MNRREFLKVIGAAGLATTALPILEALPIRSVTLGRYEGITFTQLTSEEDWGSRIGIGLQAIVSGVRYRYACSLLTESWEQMSAGQQEEVYALIKQKLVERIEASAIAA